MRKVIAAFAATAALVVAAPSSASVRLVRVADPARRGTDATLTARVSRSNVICSIGVRYKSGWSRAKGLKPKRRPVGGRVSWTWMVGTNTTHGRWGIVVSCGSVGTLRTSFVVG